MIGSDAPTIEKSSSSFRDPAGQVYRSRDGVYRTVRSAGRADYEHLRDAGIYRSLIEARSLVDTHEVPRDTIGLTDPDIAYLLSHARIPLISYPYEWPFAALKAAALFHLDLQIDLLEQDVVFTDASAYNIQFVGAAPVLMDFLSLRRYRDGEYWTGHRQFCEQFLHPLLLRSVVGITHNAMLRGSPHGIPAGDIAASLPLWRRLAPRMLMHVILPEVLAGKERARSDDDAHARASPPRPLPKTAYRSMLRQLRAWIAGLEAPEGRRSTWDDYTLKSSYSDREVDDKIQAVKRFVADVRPARLLDIGCNAGEYSELCLANGARSVVGMDIDPHACDNAFARARAKSLDLTVLQVDLSDPSPGQGWRSAELPALCDRLEADALIALAVIHHFVIGRNIPLDDATDFLVGLAPTGIIEFTAREDRQVRKMLRFRSDIFPDFTPRHFAESLSRRARIVDTVPISPTRTLYRYERAEAHGR